MSKFERENLIDILKYVVFVVSLIVWAVFIYDAKAPLKASAVSTSDNATSEIITSNPIESIAETEEVVERPDYDLANLEIVTPVYKVDLTKEEIDLLANMVLAEQPHKSFDSKCLLVATAINRLLDDTYEFKNTNTVEDVLKAYWQYANDESDEVVKECYDAVYHVLDSHNEVCPTDVFWYCEGYCPPWGTYYCNIGESYYTSINDYNN